MAAGWKKCSACFDAGLIGSAIERTLEFCDCPAGEEAAHEKGTDYPAQEVARVNATPQNRLFAAAMACGLAFAADALENSDVHDDGEQITITVPQSYKLSIVPKDVSVILEHLRIERRSSIIIGREAATA
jgi:hypothetical protein